MKTEESSSDSLRISRFTHLFQNNRAFCLQHNLTLRKVYGGKILQTIQEIFRQPRQVGEVVSSLAGEYPNTLIKKIISDLRKTRILLSQGDNDYATYFSTFRIGLEQYPIRQLYMITTLDCNFRCNYCFVKDQHISHKKLYMTHETAKYGIELFAKLTANSENITVTYYGGEPLLNPDVVYSSMHYIRQLEKEKVFKKPVEITLFTNGSCIDERTVKAVLETKARVSLSIDGPAYLHDLARKDINGAGTFTKALAGYRRLQRGGINAGISCTLSHFNVGNIDEVVDFIINEIKLNVGMSFNILLPKIRSLNEPEYDHEFATRQLIRAFKVLRERDIHEDRVMRRIAPYVGNTFVVKECPGTGAQIVLTPDGRIGPCQAFVGLEQFYPLDLDNLHARLPDITAEDIYRDKLFDEWHHRFPLNMKECIDCWAIAVCGGGCPYAAWVDHGSIWKVDTRICYQAKQIMEWMIWDTYDHLLTARSAGLPLNLSGPRQGGKTGPFPYQLSFKDTVSVKVNDDDLILFDPLGFTLRISKPTPGIQKVLSVLSGPGGQEDELCDLMVRDEGPSAAAKFYYLLGKFDEGCFLCRTVTGRNGPLATLVPMSRYFRFKEKEIDPGGRYVLSRFACCRNEDGKMILESLLGHCKLIMNLPEGMTIIQKLSKPRTAEEIVNSIEGFGPEEIEGFFNLLLNLEALCEVEEVEPVGAG